MPALAQKLARHSNINLTKSTYTSMDLEELGSAVESLPGLAPINTKQSELNMAAASNEQLVRLQGVWAQLSEAVRSRIMNVVEKELDSDT